MSSADSVPLDPAARAGSGAVRLWDPALVAVAMGTFVIVSSPGLVAISLPSLSRANGLSVSEAGWVQVTFQVAILAVLFVAAHVTERFGVRLVYVLGCLVFAVGSVGGALGGTLAVLVLARVVQGLGAALTIANNRGILAREIPVGARGRAMGVMQAASGFGSALAIVAGGALVGAVGWQGAFWLMSGLGIAAAVVARSCLPLRPLERVEPPSRSSVLLSVATFGAFAYCLAGLALGDWSGPVLRWLLAAGAAALAAFVAVERRAARPLAPWRSVVSPVFVGGNLGAVCIQAARAGVLFLVPFQLEREVGLSVGVAALLLVALPVAETVLAPVSGWLYDRYGPRLPTVSGAAVAAAAMVLMARIDPGSRAWWVVSVMAIAGVGLGLFHSANNGAVMSSVPTSLSLVASSFLATSITLGLALGAATGSGIVSGRRAHYLAGGHGPDAAFDLALRDGFRVMAALAVVAALASLFRRGFRIEPKCSV
jgi:MFS family permease